MEINLPIHKSACHQVVFNGIDAFPVDCKLLVVVFQHLYDAGSSYIAFSDTGKKTVSAEIVHSVEVKLTMYQFA